MRLKPIIFLMVLSLAVIQTAEADTFKVNRRDTLLSFHVRNVMAQATGTFRRYEGTIEYNDEHPELSSASGKIWVDTIDTGIGMRDDHLKSKSLFNVAQYPQMTFKTVKVEMTHRKKRATVTGLLTIRGVEKPITLEVIFRGVDKDPQGRTRIGFLATTTIHRKDFGLEFSPLLEAGHVLVGEDVNVELDVQATLDTGEEDAPTSSFNDLRAEGAVSNYATN